MRHILSALTLLSVLLCPPQVAGLPQEATIYSFEGTIFQYKGADYDVSCLEFGINDISSVSCAGEKIVLECHVGPKNGVYCIFDTGSESFEQTIDGCHLIWHSDDITTSVYSFWSDICTYDGEVIKSYDLEEYECIYDLAFTEDNRKLDVTILLGDGSLQTDTIDL